jgi:type II secretory pathway pseudopilin PulG
MRTTDKQSGFSILEVIVSTSLIVVMVVVVVRLTMAGNDAQEFARRLNRVTEITQDLLDDVRLELVGSLRLFGNTTEGNENLAVIDMAGAPPVLPGSRLPIVASAGQIQRDAPGNQITGNSFFYAQVAFTDRFVCSSGREYFVDVYRWVYYYLTPEDGGPQPGTPLGLNLVRLETERLVDGGQLDRITDPTDQAEVTTHLVTGTPDATGIARSPVHLVWMHGGLPTVDGTFRQIDPADGTLSAVPLAPRPPTWQVQRLEPDLSGILSYRHHSIASNHALPSWGAGRFGIIDNSGAGFPHGFEVQIVGPSSARQVLVHMIVCSANRKGQAAWSDLQSVIDTKDL